jgi:hypothetical protein
MSLPIDHTMSTTLFELGTAPVVSKEDSGDTARAVGVGIVGLLLSGGLSYLAHQAHWPMAVSIAWAVGLGAATFGVHHVLHRWIFRDVPELYRPPAVRLTALRMVGVALAAGMAMAVTVPGSGTVAQPTVTAPPKLALTDVPAEPTIDQDTWILPVVTQPPSK